ncbi:MAG: hypothetical protein ACXWZB_05630 [Gaiellaceae bacterium]
MERRLRIAAVASILAWLFVPALRDAIPVWIPFFALAAFEAHFLISGLRDGGGSSTPRGRAPQADDIDEFGGPEWLEPIVVEVEGREVWVPAEVEREPRPARPARRLLPRLEGVAVLAILAAVLIFLLPERGWRGLDEREQARTEARLSAEAARIAGHPTRIRCDAKGQAVGVVQHADGIAEVGGRNAFLTPEICFRLHRLAFEDDEGAFSQTARAIAVLAHEAWHLRGEADEGVTNCYAFQSGVELGRRLGLGDREAARMMRQQLAENPIQAQSAPAYLVPPGCRDGGELDLSPGSSRFP